MSVVVINIIVSNLFMECFVNAPAKIDIDTATETARDQKNPTPADLEITVRDERFNRNSTPNRWSKPSRRTVMVPRPNLPMKSALS